MADISQEATKLEDKKVVGTFDFALDLIQNKDGTSGFSINATIKNIHIDAVILQLELYTRKLKEIQFKEYEKNLNMVGDSNGNAEKY